MGPSAIDVNVTQGTTQPQLNAFHKQSMEDPREIAWQSRCDDHSHNIATRVAFSTIYARTIPNARLEHYYKSKLPSLQKWVATRLERESALNAAEEMGQVEDVQDQGMPDTDMEMDVVIPRARGGKGRFAPEREKTPPIKAAGVVGSTKTPASTKGRKKRSQLEMLLSTMGQDVRKPEVIMTPGGRNGVDGSSTSGDTMVEDKPPIPIPATSTAEQAPTDLSQVPKKPRTKPVQPITKPESNIKTKRTPKPRITTSSSTIIAAKPSKPKHHSLKKPTSRLNEKKPEQIEPSTKPAPKAIPKYPTPGLLGQSPDYDILPHIPGVTEVIFDRYPILRTQPKRKTDEVIRARLDTGRLVLMCMKATRQKNIVKAGVENSVVGGVGVGVGELVFLRRNVVRVKRAMGI